jgi:carbon starvation protein
MNQWGLPMALGTAYGAVFLCLMALTIMYLVVRFMRVASAEALGDKIPVMKNVHVGTIVALLLTLALIWLVPFLQIWVMFGAANQLMASLALLLVTLWLMSKGKNYQWTIWPFAFMFITTIGALLYKVWEAFFRNLPNAVANAEKAKLTVAQYTTAQIIIGLVALILIVTAFILAWDGLQAIRRLRAQVAAPAKAGGGE